MLKFETITYFHSNPIINTFALSEVLSDVRVTQLVFLFLFFFLFLKFQVT